MKATARFWIYAAITAAGTVAGSVFAAQIVVGQVGPMSGLDANQGRAYAAGMQLYFNEVNRIGGVNGHTFMLLRKDDFGRPEDTVAITRQLLYEQRPLVLAGYFGNENISAIVATGLLEKERIALVGYRTSEVRPDTPYLYSVRASTRDELSKFAEHLATTGITRIGLLYEEGTRAPALLSAADGAAARVGASIVVRASYAPNTVAVARAVDTFISAQPQAIIMVSSGAATAAFVERYRGVGGSAQLFAHSGADIEQLSKRLTEGQMQGIAIAQVTPSPYRVSSRLAKQFIDAVSHAPNLEVSVSFAMMEGYITARVLAEAVRRQGPSPSRDGMVAALDSLENLDLGGYVVSFRGQRFGSKFVELSIVSSAGKIKQ
ncbi:MAG TPA: ABC transporter substrate-binding protein [Burkholderiaceae bacterium]|jgi:ABC-type branched-subunit amino acid transport system substrate-binding protein|nr:ABC transporter substrate-binding protein [Burkholderiaceae bacterium]